VSQGLANVGIGTLETSGGCSTLAHYSELDVSGVIEMRPPRPHHIRERIEQRRRADALALIAESSVRSYPSWIAELKRKSLVTSIDRRQYAYENIRPGEALELVRGPADPDDSHAVAYHHRGVLLGYVPRRHRWIAKALDDGLRLAAIAERIKIGGIFRRRAKFIGTRIVVLRDGR
jgi:HIRAN domain